MVAEIDTKSERLEKCPFPQDEVLERALEYIRTGR
jgi:hypothetical protein